MRAPEMSAPPPRPNVTVPKRRPDARPTRIVLGLSTIAAMSIVTAGMVRFPLATTSDVLAIGPATSPGTQETVVHRVRYVRLKPGQQAPAGATVIHDADPTPRIVIRTVPARRSATTTPRRRPVARTRQSGR